MHGLGTAIAGAVSTGNVGVVDGGMVSVQELAVDTGDAAAARQDLGTAALEFRPRDLFPAAPEYESGCAGPVGGLKPTVCVATDCGKEGGSTGESSTKVKGVFG